MQATPEEAMQDQHALPQTSRQVNAVCQRSVDAPKCSEAYSVHWEAQRHSPLCIDLPVQRLKESRRLTGGVQAGRTLLCF